MAIVCPRCGREYDVTLFQFGRTVDCACGARVGLERRIPLERASPAAAADDDAAPRFFADAMLGGLARWLRILGYDTRYEERVDDERLVRTALEEGRRILTRDRRLPEEWRVEGVTLVEAEEPTAQLREVVARLDLRPRRSAAFRRCPVCNAELEPAEPDEVSERVPDRVLQERDRFRRCPGCGKVYWRGGHVRRILARLADLFVDP